MAGRLQPAAVGRCIVGRLTSRLRATLSFHGRELLLAFWFLWLGTLVNFVWVVPRSRS